MKTYLLLTYNLKLGGIFTHIATTEKESECKQIKEGMCVGDDMFKWAEVIEFGKFGEFRISKLDTEQFVYNSPNPEFPCWMTKTMFEKHFDFNRYYKVPETKELDREISDAEKDWIAYQNWDFTKRTK